VAACTPLEKPGAGVAEPGVTSVVPATSHVHPRIVEVPDTEKFTADCALDVAPSNNETPATRAIRTLVHLARAALFTTDISVVLRKLGATN
jgi:hypothetical protein